MDHVESGVCPYCGNDVTRRAVGWVDADGNITCESAVESCVACDLGQDHDEDDFEAHAHYVGNLRIPR